MSSTIAALREAFLNPPNSFRHLAIIHQLFTQRSFAWDSETGPISDERPVDYKERFGRRLSDILDMGFGGIVVNIGHRNYLEDDEEWSLFLTGFKAAKDLGMRIWIYDEHGYPSGAAGGVVLRDHPEYEAQGLVRMQETFDGGEVCFRPPSGWLYAVRAEARFDDSDSPVDVTSSVQPDGYLRFCASDRCTITRFDARRAFEGTHATRNVFRIRRYINVLSEEAVRYFYKVTEERYFKHLDEDTACVEAIFTDEPSFMAAYFPDLLEKWKGTIPVQDSAEDAFDRLPMIAWDHELPDKFAKRWGCDLIPELNSLYEGNRPHDLRVRHDFYQLQSEVYARSFFETQQELLDKKGAAFSGHVLAEESLVQHVASEGNVMANLACMRMPGIDMLNSIGEEILDSLHLLTCKYGSSAAHAAGREQVMSEASDWEQRNADRPTSVRERMGALAVQMALGVTTITSYYQWKDIASEDTRRLLDAVARLATVVRCGTHIADFAVLYPIRTAWSYYKPTDQVLSPASMDEPLRSMDVYLHHIARSLIARGLDFDFIDTRDLIGALMSDGKLHIGGESYSMLIIPPGAVMCPKDLQQTEEFVKAGGRVLAFDPCSDFALPEIDSPSTGNDMGPGRSPRAVIEQLEIEVPDRVRRLPVEGDWIKFAETAASRDIGLDLNGTHLVARRSVYENTDFVLLANGSQKEAVVRAAFGRGRLLELWDPWSGNVVPVSSSAVQTRLGPYSAVIIISARQP